MVIGRLDTAKEMIWSLFIVAGHQTLIPYLIVHLEKWQDSQSRPPDLEVPLKMESENQMMHFLKGRLKICHLKVRVNENISDSFVFIVGWIWDVPVAWIYKPASVLQFISLVKGKPRAVPYRSLWENKGHALLSSALALLANLAIFEKLALSVFGPCFQLPASFGKVRPPTRL